MGLIQKLTVKPWMEEGVEADERVPGAPAYATKKIALWVFLGAITSLFSLFVSAYFIRMTYADWRVLPEPNLLWLNTFVLLASSFAMQWAVSSAHNRRLGSVRNGLALGGLFAFIFLIGQLLVWRDLAAQGYYLTSNPANSFFFLLTALHGIHLTGGLVAWAYSFARSWQTFNAFDMAPSVELCAIYWHFLLVVWIVLFAVLLST